jgi:DHA2 family multidrug resistance protein
LELKGDILAGDQANQDWRPKYNPWLIAVVVAIAAFMEVLDTSIANVALPHISGNLGASQDQSTWVLTTYLVANAIVLPITGWITSVMGRKRFFLVCIALFTVTSFLCGIAPSLGFLLLARAIQGIGGGGLQPMAQAIMADSFPAKLRGAAFALYGVTVVVAPALGPTLGGWITDNYSWRWIFLINVPVGLLAMGLVIKLVEDPPFLRRFKSGEMHFDAVGFSLLALGIAALQILLDKGQEDDWFGSNFITSLVAISFVCLSAVIVWEWRQKQPIVDVKLFKILNFSSASLMMFLAGAVAFSSTILMPQFLQILAGYTAEKAGLVVSVGALLMLLTMPVIGALTSKIPAKYLIAFGWFLSASGLYISTNLLSLGISFGTAYWGSAGSKRFSLRADQLHAKHWEQRRRFGSDNDYCPSPAIPYGPACGAPESRIPGPYDGVSNDGTGPRRRQCRNAGYRAGFDLPSLDGTGRRIVVPGCLHGAGSRVSCDVLPFVPAQIEQPQESRTA